MSTIKRIWRNLIMQIIEQLATLGSENASLFLSREEALALIDALDVSIPNAKKAKVSLTNVTYKLKQRRHQPEWARR